MLTTDILFNSPALHSLKRAQLVQLCKKHNIKASGKNTELVARLKEHAQGLPPGAPLSVAVRSETESDGAGNKPEDANDDALTDISDEDKVEEQLTSPTNERKSQAWDMISRGSVESKRSVATAVSRNQAGEFGSVTRSKSTILRSIASSIGLARSPSNGSMPAAESSDDLSASPNPRSIFSSFMPRSRANSHESQIKGKEGTRKSLLTHAVPYGEIPVPSVSRRPRIEPFAFSYAGAEDTSLGEDSIISLDRPVPGVGSCLGVNATSGIGTVRLITNGNKPTSNEEEIPKLVPVVPAFDLIPPTPRKTGLYKFPAATPERNRTLYPTITEEDQTIDLEALTSPAKKASEEGKGKSLPVLTESSPVSPTNPKEPFIFGSPNPRHSTTPADFSNAASSVLAEMNARLNAAGGLAIDPNVLAHSSAGRSKDDVEALLKYEFGIANKKNEEGNDGKGDSVSKKFDKLHEKAFARMDGIDTHYAAKRTQKHKEKDEKVERLPETRKRKQSALDARKSVASASAKKRNATSGVTPKKTTTVTIPGAFEAEEMSVDESIARTAVAEEREADVAEDNERGAKRACVQEIAADGETHRIAVAPHVRKNTNDKDEVDEERKRKESEAIKRRLELNRARRRSNRGRLSTALRTPTQKKGFLSSAKTFVKNVWNRGGNLQAGSSVPSYLRATAASSKRTTDQETKPAVAAARKPTVSRTSSVRATSNASGAISRKPSASRKHPGEDPAATSELEPVNETGGDKVAKADVPSQAEDSNQSTRPCAPILGSVKPRKAYIAAPVAKRPNDAGTTTTVSRVPSRASRLLAPTASSLAKQNGSPTKPGVTTNNAPLRTKVPSVRARPSVMSPSKIPVFSPAQKKQGVISPNAHGNRIFGSAFVLSTSPQAREAAEKGQDVNPITGVITPSRRRVPFSNANGQSQSLMGAAVTLKKDANSVNEGAKGEEVGAQNESPTKLNKALNSLRKPRMSRSKVIARLDANRIGTDGPSGLVSPCTPGSPSKTSSGKGPATPKVRSTTGATIRRSLGGQKARESSGTAVVLSAKKRARATEYARRKSVKSPIRGSDFSKTRTSETMLVDD